MTVMIDRYNQMPRRVIQNDLSQVDYTDYYEIYWDGPNSDFGSFRASPLKGNIAQGKREVINVLKAAYNVSLKSFDDARSIAKQTGVRILRVKDAQYISIV